MSALTLIAILVALIIAICAIWFVIRSIRYRVTVDYEVDQRLRNICR